MEKYLKCLFVVIACQIALIDCNDLGIQRYLVGAPTSIDSTTLQDILRHTSESFTQALDEGNQLHKLKEIKDAQKQIVAGNLYRVEAVVETPDGEKNCSLKIWIKSWLNFRELTMICADGHSLKVKTNHLSPLQHATPPSPSKTFDGCDDDDDHPTIDLYSTLNADRTEFDAFKTEFDRNYIDEDETAKRFNIFQRNLAKIRKLNQCEQGTATYGVNEHADLTEDEFKQRTGLWPRSESTLSNEIGNPLADIPNIELAESFDWRERNAVTPVKNQESCGSCWAFSVTGNIEGLYAIQTGKLQSFSEQELVDCDDLDAGCNGGLPDNAVKFLEKEGGLELESDYPYTAHRSKCHFNESLSRVRVSGVIDFKHGDEDGMAKWLSVNGPISIGINANGMQFYRGGVSHPWKALCRSSSLDHGVLIVGYGVSTYPKFNKTMPYWIIKNSWGSRWGEQGYYRVYRGDNTCGVSSMASSAVLAKSTKSVN